MALVLLLRLRQAQRNTSPMRYVVQCVALAGIALCTASYLLKAHQWLLLSPVVVNLVLLAAEWRGRQRVIEKEMHSD